MSKAKYKKQNKIIKIIIIVIIIIITNDKTKVVVGAYLSMKKGGLYNTCHELLSEKWIVNRSRFHVSSITLPQLLATFATSHLVGCTEY